LVVLLDQKYANKTYEATIIPPAGCGGATWA
jgi:hypothetical protein